MGRCVNCTLDLAKGAFRVRLSITDKKVTLHGEPVVDLSSSFRKPYEIMLIARKPTSDNAIKIPERKVIIAVPGFHSQKPCMKGNSEDEIC